MNTERRLYQWDTGQKLVGCTGLYVDFPIGNEVYRVETVDGMCIIPDELLQTSGKHKVYECMTNNTIRSFAFSVTPRPKPPDYVYTPTERLTFEGLVQKVDDAVADMIRRAESGEFDGYTPVKGKDYFTTAEIQQIQNEVSSGAIGEFKSAVNTETNKFNVNATEKLNAYNSNAGTKLNAYNTNANNKVAEFDSHTEQIQTDIGELKSDLDDLWENPSKYSPFQKGALTSGNIINGDYRIVSTNIIHATNDVFVRIDEGRRIGVQGYDENGKYLWDSGWKKETYFIPKNTYFRICISAFPESVNEEYSYNADIDTLLSFVRFNHVTDVVNDLVEKVSENTDVLKRLGDSFNVNESDFESGSYYDNGMLDSSDQTVIRMKNKNTYHIKQGYVINGKGVLLIRLYKKIGNNYQLATNYVEKYVVPSDSDYCFVIKYADSRNIDSIADCLSYLEVKLYGELDDLRNDIDFGLSKIYPRYPFKPSITTEEVFSGASDMQMQGGAINGNMLFYGMTNDDVNATITKYDLSTNTEVLSVVGSYGHAGDMTYNTETNKLIVIDGKASQSNIYVLNPDTLELEDTVQVPYKLGAIAFNPLTSGYILEVCSNSAFWNDYRFIIVGSDFKEISTHEPIKNGYLMQGIECDGKYIYAMYAFPNLIFIYDMDMRYVGYHKVDFNTESEFIAKYDDETFYISENSNKSVFKATRTFEWE